MANRAILCFVLCILLLGNMAIIGLSVVHAINAFKIVKLSDQNADIAE
jgi:hypothetical protein